MPLTTKQKAFIEKNFKSLSAEKIAKQLNANLNEIRDFIDSLKSAKKYPVWFYFVPFILAITFILSLEGILRILNYGEEIPLVLDVGETYYVINPDIAKRYFSNIKNPPSPANDFFKKNKSEDTYRVVVLGGSSAAGFPYTPSFSFSKYLREALIHSFPEKRIEVINTALSAVNSYTLLDISKELINYSPDLVCIYAGHNEYYGALGVASTESLGRSRFLIKTFLFLQDVKIVQLLKNIIGEAFMLFNSEENKSGTLMARMTKEKSIEYNSSLFQNGIEQFEGNLSEIVEIFNSKNIPIIFSNLASNLKDQKPFVSLSNSEFVSADSVYYKALVDLKNKDFKSAESNFRFAKDLDALRFRAPEEINSIIKKLSTEQNLIFLNSDSILSSKSKGNIIGDDLMTDHLHPTLYGYQLIGKGFFEKIIENNLVENSDKINIEQVDSLVNINLDFTKLDSTIAKYRITILKTDWPFVENQLSKQAVLNYLNPINFIDSLALQILDNKLNFLQAHQEAAKYYVKKGDLKKFNDEIDYLISFIPETYENYDFGSELLISYKYFDEALELLIERYNKKPNGFSTKWIGTIYLNKNKNQEAIKYLKESIAFNPRDAQLLYNLSGAYIKLNDYQNAKIYIDQCVNLNANFPNAKQIQTQLKRVINP